MTTNSTPFGKSLKKFEPRSEQFRGMKLIVSGRGSRLFLKPGRGKTAVTLKAFQTLKRLGMVDALLVICPLRVAYSSWPQEMSKWSDFEDLTHVIVHGGPEARRKAMESDVDVYVMNMEALLSPEWKPTQVNQSATGRKSTRKNMSYRPNPFATKFLERRRFMLVVDESTKFKDSNSNRFISLKQYLHMFHRAVILTGTPRPQSLEDLWSQCYITDLGEDLGQFITHYRSEYMMPNESGHGYTAQPGAFERVGKKIAHRTLQLEAEEVVPVENVDIWIPMPEEVRKLYNELKKEFIASIGDRTVMAINSGVLWGKLRQLAQGAILPSGDDILNGVAKEGEYAVVHDLKLDALESILEELQGDPAFCLYHYNSDYQRINARLGYAVPRIGSGITPTQGRAHALNFGAGALPLLLGQPQSVALGVDGLQNNCGNVIWFANTPSWEQEFQANLRVVRPGTKADSVTIYRIMLDCAVERALRAMVQDKKQSEEEMLAVIRQHMWSEE